MFYVVSVDTDGRSYVAGPMPNREKAEAFAELQRRMVPLLKHIITFVFAVPKVCECGRPITVEGPDWVELDPVKYREFARRANEVLGD